MNKVSTLVQKVKAADAVVVGAGSGMSNAAGMDFWYEKSPLLSSELQYFQDKYNFAGLFQGFYNHFESEEERWAFLLQLGKFIRETPPQKPTYEYLKTLMQDKTVLYVTTNQDGLFKRYFPAEQVSEIQGSWEFLQSSNPSTDKHLYPLKPILTELLPKIKNHRLPYKDFPRSKVDGAPLINWVRGPEFLEDQLYFENYQKINTFLGQHQHEKVLFLEMGVGRMTPMFIQEPFWELTAYNQNSFYININPKDALTNPKIEDRSLLIDEDINEVLKEAAEQVKEGK